MKKEKLLSEKIKDAISVFELCISEYQTAYAEVNNCDKATQDLLHAIELGDSKGRDRLATRLSHIRKERRKWKDIVDTREPLYLLLTSQDKIDSKRFNSKLSDILGETRKREHSKENRIYIPKILTDIGLVYETKESAK